MVDVLANIDGFFYFHIPDESFRRKILDGGPITILRIPMILQQWHPAIQLKKNQHESLPIWVKLRHIPVALWSATGISAIASTIGKPLHVDIQTERMRMISYARVYIEIKATQSLLESVDLLLNDKTWLVKLEYEWKPISCTKCGTFGHKCATKIELPAMVGKPPMIVAEIGDDALPVGDMGLSQPSASVPPPPMVEKPWQLVKKRHTARKSTNKDPSTASSPQLPHPLPCRGLMAKRASSEHALSSHSPSPASSEFGESNEHLASDVSSDSNSPFPGQASTRKCTASKNLVLHSASPDTSTETPGVDPQPKQAISPPVEIDLLLNSPAPTVAVLTLASKLLAPKANPGSRKWGGARKR